MSDNGEGATMAGTAVRRVLRLRAGKAEWQQDHVAAEVPVALSAGGRTRAVMLGTPRDLQDFALGFCLSEAIAESPDQLRDVHVREHLEGIELELDLMPEALARFEARTQALEGRSGCGLCGASSLAQVLRLPAPVHGDVRIRADVLPRALAAIARAQPLNAACGAMHAAAWCDRDGAVFRVREDVGRHNALDKLIGALHRQAAWPARGFLLLTSRASYEMVMKAATAGIAVLVAISAPTALAVALAEQSGVTLVGFARGEDCVIYSHAGRIEL